MCIPNCKCKQNRFATLSLPPLYLSYAWMMLGITFMCSVTTNINHVVYEGEHLVLIRDGNKLLHHLDKNTLHWMFYHINTSYFNQCPPPLSLFLIQPATGCEAAWELQQYITVVQKRSIFCTLIY